MALESDLKSSLVWVIEQPRVGMPEQSSYFHLFGEVWYIKISFSGFGFGCLNGSVLLFSESGKKTIEKGVSASCLLSAGKLVFGDLKKFSTLSSEMVLLNFNFPSQDFQINLSQRWIICCRISCVEPVPIQINNETIHLSTGPLPTAPNPSVQTCAEFPPDLQRLSDDFCRLLDKEIIPDAKLTCCGRTWNVHRSILTARSEVFAAMFGSGMVESETGAVRIEDIEAPALDSLLKYVYSGKVPDVSGENVSSVYEAADRYALHGLREACSYWMAKELSRKNCLGFLVVADAHCDDGLKEAAVSFITKHFAQIERAIWTNFRKEHSLLAIEVLERFAPSMEE